MNVRIGSRHEFIGVVESFNSKHICLEDVRFNTIDCELLRDHLWLVYCRKWKRLELRKGDVVRFSGKINQYNHWGKYQFELTNIREIIKVETS